MKIKKVFFLILIFICCMFCGFAKNSKKAIYKQKKYIGLEAGLYVINQYPLGDFSEYAKATLGGEIFVNYLLPKKLIKIDNLGVSANFGFEKVFSNGKYVEKFSKNYFSIGAFYLFNLTKKIQLKPQLNLGMIFHNFEGGYVLKDTYSDFMISASCDVRYLWKYNLIFNLSPVYTFVPVKDGIINYFGFKLGASYRF